MGQEIGHTGGAVYGLEECVCTRGEQERATPGGGAGDAIWSDVPAPGDSHPRGQFGAGERSSREKPRYPPGSPGEENAAAENQNPCGGQQVSGESISARAQSAVSACPGPARGLSSSGPAGGGVGGSFSSGKRASHGQRLGGAARQPLFPGESSGPALCAGQGQSHGVRMGGWATTDSLSR